ncbi:MAG: helix-turn-helix transcriptional regulator [Deltaproteobacteria bacterium]|jgi:transcriptional regulator with XRE-family HTH domain|nr:helix-turn-helix transcriptional regulator [Deltaproteobacteria bacterium]MBW1874060.1 helix-turn-helix transcriptional regulator [Deltaproteobacteria bacterium]MBW2209623.1 helix-turn-helix transcriptional regulator [Deltaproteobacteria bacterium]MBW2214423.1 helix-turn-helix transcriptional regulator [Deltaproteobacteria bacterium]MBW2379271.1 helix-turn-helix transcriptional regulator [Deltaproteobacteria bacterium]
MPAIDVISANLPILRELRNRIGQLELAERVGVSRRTIARLENAEVADPGVDLMTRIAGELGASLALVTESQLRAVALALPEDVCDRLGSKQGAEILDAMVRAARHAR